MYWDIHKLMWFKFGMIIYTIELCVTKKESSGNLWSDHKGWHRKWSQIGENDTKERLVKLKAIKKLKPVNINTQKLKGMKERFEINLKSRF